MRKLYLRYRLAELEKEAERDRSARKRAVKRSGLQVLPGGKDDKPPPPDQLN
jgi:hypothetical protein